MKNLKIKMKILVYLYKKINKVYTIKEYLFWKINGNILLCNVMSVSEF